MLDVISSSPAEWLRFGLGLLVIAGLYLSIRRLRQRDGQSPFVAALLESRMQYAVAGFVMGALALPGLKDGLGLLVSIIITFVVGWFGFALGCGIDLRTFRRRARARLQTDSVQVLLSFGMLALGIYFLKTSSDAGVQSHSWPSVLLILAICLVGSGRQQLEAVGPRQAAVEQPGLSVSSLAAVLLAGMARSWLSPGSFSIDYPFAAGRDLLIGGLVDEAIFSVTLGVALGVVANLVCRDIKPEMMFYPLAGVLLLGCGIANGLGLEPLWVGLVSGAWLINATLRRVDMIDTLELGRRHLPLGVLFFAGWLTGTGLSHSFRWDLFLWVVALVVVIRPLSRLLAIRVVATWSGETNPGRVSRGASRGGPDGNGLRGGVRLHVLQIGELALAIAIGCTRLMGTEPGLSVLAGVLVGYGVTRVAGSASSGLLVRIFSVGPTR